jgi:hypothetical protein
MHAGHTLAYRVLSAAGNTEGKAGQGGGRRRLTGAGLDLGGVLQHLERATSHVAADRARFYSRKNRIGEVTMANRGPKPKTAMNSGSHQAGFIRGPHVPTSDLTPGGHTEFTRLVGMLTSMGTLERVDMGIVTEASRVKAALDEIHAENDTRGNIKVIGILTSQLRGLNRELGLTLHPSRSVVNGHRPALSSKWGDKLKVY